MDKKKTSSLERGTGNGMPNEGEEEKSGKEKKKGTLPPGTSLFTQRLANGPIRSCTSSLVHPQGTPQP